MTYEKTTWSTDSVLSVENLQKIETQYDLTLGDLDAHVAAGHTDRYYTREEMDSLFWSENNDGDGSGLNADTISGRHAPEIMGGVPSGFMCWWNPENGSIPAGWSFCDGSNGTPDMRAHFPIGASGTAGGEIGNSSITPMGSVTVASCTLTVANIHHSHNLYDGYGQHPTLETDVWGTGKVVAGEYTDSPNKYTGSAGGGGSHNHPGTFAGNASSIDPVYRYLVIIQKA